MFGQVAFGSGFADQSHLTQQFKQSFGITPKRWQQLHLRVSTSLS
jgi:AraC-like DNA-binding protein